MLVFFAIRRSSFCRVPVRAPSRPAVLQPPRDSADVLQLSADRPWRPRLPLRGGKTPARRRSPLTSAWLPKSLAYFPLTPPHKLERWSKPKIWLSRRSIDLSVLRRAGCRPRCYRSARFLSAEDARDKGRRGFCLVGAIQQGNTAASWPTSPDPSPRDWLTGVIASLWPDTETRWGLKQAGPHRWQWLTTDSLGLTLWARLDWEFLMVSNAMLQ